MTYDVIFVLPYAFSDHPSFPEGILKRALEFAGFNVGVIERPFWQSKDSFAALGKPNLFFAIISGPLDSVVLNYTSSRKRRTEDLYQLEGVSFFEGHPRSIKSKVRPDRTLLVFAHRIREAFKDTPIIIGGVEASLRRFAHYDFQQDSIRRSILADSRADLLVHGMGEKQLVEIARYLQKGSSVHDLDIPGTAKMVSSNQVKTPTISLPSFDSIQKDPTKLMEAQLLMEKAHQTGSTIIQPHGDRCVISHPSMAYEASDLDFIYGLTYKRNHPNHRSMSPALQMNLFSVTSHRGCIGGCAFCSIGVHDGKQVISRSADSILREIRALTKHPQWKGSLSDIGGASVEMYGSGCNQQSCPKPSCLFPSYCSEYRFGQPYLELLRQSRKIKGVKKVFLGSGIRYDLLLKAPELCEEIMQHHAGRFLRVAPEHTEDHVLKLMKKPPFEVFEEFIRLFHTINKNLKRKIELATYLIVGHPGENRKDTDNMRKKLRSLGIVTTDTQVFTPSPGTLSTAMYVTGLSPTLNKSLPVTKEIKELIQRKKMIQ